jgi:hypothetical protein
MTMKESSTYQALWKEAFVQGWKEGALAAAKKILRMWGDDAFGVPDARTAAAIERCCDLPRVEAMIRQVHSARSWQEVLNRSYGVARKRAKTHVALEATASSRIPRCRSRKALAQRPTRSRTVTGR